MGDRSDIIIAADQTAYRIALTIDCACCKRAIDQATIDACKCTNAIGATVDADIGQTKVSDSAAVGIKQTGIADRTVDIEVRNHMTSAVELAPEGCDTVANRNESSAAKHRPAPQKLKRIDIEGKAVVSTKIILNKLKLVRAANCIKAIFRPRDFPNAYRAGLAAKVSPVEVIEIGVGIGIERKIGRCGLAGVAGNGVQISDCAYARAEACRLARREIVPIAIEDRRASSALIADKAADICCAGDCARRISLAYRAAHLISDETAHRSSAKNVANSIGSVNRPEIVDPDQTSHRVGCRARY